MRVVYGIGGYGGSCYVSRGLGFVVSSCKGQVSLVDVRHWCGVSCDLGFVDRGGRGIRGKGMVEVI